MNAMQFAVGAELLAAPGQNLMSVGLMPYIPHDAVVRSIVHIVQSHSQFHGTQARCQVAGIDRQLVHDVTPEFFTDLRQLVDLQLAQIVGILNMVQQPEIFLRLLILVVFLLFCH